MKKKLLVCTGIIICIAVIIGIVCIVIQNSNKNEVSKIDAIYEKLLNNQSYMFTTSLNDKNKTIIGKDGDNTVIDMYTDNEHTTTLIKEGNTYLILHDREEYYVYANNNIEANRLTDDFQELKEKTDYTTGSEKIDGKKYKYQEYKGVTDFTLSSITREDEESVITRFYFNKDELVYIKNIIGGKEELLKVDLQYSIDSNLFKIPSNYAEN